MTDLRIRTEPVLDDTWYKCTMCGREGRVGRCCGVETRIPLNDLAKEEQRKLKNDFNEEMMWDGEKNIIEILNTLFSKVSIE